MLRRYVQELSVMNPENQISIDEGKWIDFGDLAGQQDQAVSIDSQVAHCMEFWDELESDCEAPCCGIHAFALWPKDIARVSKNIGEHKAKMHIAELKQHLSQCNAPVVVSQRLNQYFLKEVFEELLDHIDKCIGST